MDDDCVKDLIYDHGCHRSEFSSRTGTQEQVCQEWDIWCMWEEVTCVPERGCVSSSCRRFPKVFEFPVWLAVPGSL